ncbi:hypothetical protein ACFQ1M_07680 [Sungkyunkwania multivorans]|uniref:Uncharacterized protein n=1 Tax=Sungkyunkwania multivorans TaxID=1173618 RepID=A0ABW3CZ23_9FLAO
MKTSEIKLFCLSILTVLLSTASINANDHEQVAQPESLDMIAEKVPLTAENIFHLDVEVYDNLDAKTFTAALMTFSCYRWVWKRVWIWDGWRPRRVWKWVRVPCAEGPGTTIPPH